MKFKRLLNDVYSYILLFVNCLIKKEKNSLFFIPHSNCEADGYDIINYTSDNVLVLCDSILRDKRFSEFKISVLIHDTQKRQKYVEHCRNLGFNGTIQFVSFADRVLFLNLYCKSSFIFTDNYYSPIKFKSWRQRTICLGYFVCPFKDDFFKIKRYGYFWSLYIELLNNRIYDYHVSTSDYCSRELSVDSRIYLPKYIPLGFPRNDVLTSSEKSYRDSLVRLLGFSPRSIIAYVPTHRNYENQNSHFNCGKASHRSIFGEIPEEEEQLLVDFLEQENAVIIAKMHPIQNTKVLRRDRHDRIVYYDDLVNQENISLQEILAGSDLMITDYSTACFDYLLTDRPCIYFFDDYELERKTRGFFIDPMTSLCAGDIVYDIVELCNSIKDNVANPNKYSFHRHFVRSLLFKETDGHATDRVKDFVLDLVGR